MAEASRPAAELPPGTVLAERYRIKSTIGEGGMGKVYAAEHVLMRKKLAIKVLHRELSSVPELVARFEREAMAAANIDHPNVAAATDFGKLPDGSVFLALELIEGRCLRDVMDTGPLEVRRALHVARQIAAALGSAHSQGIVHRDLKPENVMLVEKGGDADFVKVLDFGVAKVPIGEGDAGAGHVITRAGMVFGTPEYIPPEQALGQSSDGRADLYSLGVILFEMIAGVRPFVGETKLSLVGQHVGKPPPRVSERAPGLVVAREVEELVGRLLEKELQKRVQTAGELVSAIDVLIGRSKRSPFRTPIIQKPLETLGAPAAALDPSLAERLDRRTDAPSPGERLRNFANDLVGRSRRYWPRPLRTPLDRVPPLRLFLAAIALIVLVPVGLVLAARAALGPSEAEEHAERAAARGGERVSSVGSRASSDVAPAASGPVARLRDPDEETLSAARRGGIDALSKLGERFPGSPAGELELARYYVANKDYVNAVSAIERALTIDPEAKSDGRAASALFQTAQSKTSADAAFRLLQGAMKERGAAIVHDLAVYAPKGSPAQRRAEGWLGSAGFSAVALPPLRVAVALRHAKSCAEVRALLPQAKAVGDKQSLVYLEFFQQRLAKYPCLKSDTLLADTTTAVAARAGN
ncbi:MAG TPA: protein kinase [Polyangiaceae bacterium]|nr:protein kinase [Polyangiaceae bacterium]